jgi:hypothetical protein
VVERPGCLVEKHPSGKNKQEKEKAPDFSGAFLIRSEFHKLIYSVSQTTPRGLFAELALPRIRAGAPPLRKSQSSAKPREILSRA